MISILLVVGFVAGAGPEDDIVGEINGRAQSFMPKRKIGPGQNLLTIDDVKAGELTKGTAGHEHRRHTDPCQLTDGGLAKDCWDIDKTGQLTGLKYTLADAGTIAVDFESGGDSGNVDDIGPKLDAIAKRQGMEIPLTDKGYYQENACPGKADHAILAFDTDGNPLRQLAPVDEDDVVTVVVFPAGDAVIENISLTKCSGAPAVRVLGNISEVVLAARGIRSAEAQYVVATACSADDGIEVSVKLKNKTDAKVIKVKTLPLYRITVAAGFIYDFTRVVDYRADSVKGEAVPLIVESRHSAGLGAVGFVTLRTYKADTTRSRFRGATGVWQMLLNFSLGVSITDPLEHIYAGINIEPYPGAGIVVGYHFFARKYLGGGYQVGDRFTGGSVVPVDKRWTASGVKDDSDTTPLPNLFIGFTLDSSILSRILSALNR